MTHASEVAVGRARRYARGAGLVTFAAAVAAFAGWILDIERLKSAGPGHAPMMPMTAVSFALLGVAIAWRSRTGEPRSTVRLAVVRTTAAIAALIGAATVFEYLSGLDLGFDTWLFPAKVSADSSAFAGRMAHAAAVSLLCLGLAILFEARQRARVVLSNTLTVIATSIGMLGVAGYLYGASALYGFSGYASVSLPTAILVLVASTGILALQPQRGVVVEVLSRHSGGVMARRLLPAAMLVPFVFGWLETRGLRIGLYSDAFGEALSAALNLSALVALIWIDARLLNRLDRQRQAADAMARAALAESERRYRTMAESLPQLVWTCTPDGFCDYLSPQWVAYTGLQAARHLGSGWADPAHPDDRQAVFAQWGRASLSGDRLDTEVRLRGVDGTYRWFHTLATPLRDEDGRIVKWFGTSTDIDDRKRAEAELQGLTSALEHRVEERTRELQAAKERAESADRLKTDFIMSMSHELRTPLNAIIGFSGTLLMRMPGPLTAEQESQLRLVQSNGRHLLMLISDVLDVARIEAGTFEVGRDAVDASAVVRDVVAELTPLAREKGLTIEFAMPPFSVELTTDQRALRQILINLMSNAIKFTERGGVTVALEEAHRDDRDVVDIAVTDTGVGIAAADLPRLFTKFGQLSRAGTTSAGGTGLGLYLSQTLAERLGGRITVASVPGQGSCFVLTLPI